MKQIIIIFILFEFTIGNIFAQDNDYILAINYFKDKEFEKAAPLYLNLYQRTKTTNYFNFYLQCLYQIKDFKIAEKAIKKEIKVHPDNTAFRIFLGQTYQMQQDTSKAAGIFDKILKSIPNSQQNYINTANDFIRIRALDYAEKTYQQGQKKLKGQYSFEFELGYLYFLERKWEKMIESYLDVLSFNPNFYSSVQMRLESALYNDDGTFSSLLKMSLIRRIQSHPSKTIFNELLIWFYLQENDTQKALQQAKALDKRKKEQNFENVLKIGKLALSNDQLELASDAFSFVLKNINQSSVNGLQAKYLYLETQFRQITIDENINTNQLNTFKNDLESTFSEKGIDNNNFFMGKIYSKLLAFYFHEPNKAIEFLITHIATPGLSKHNQTELQIELANDYIANNEPWEAVLLLAKIEKDNKNNPQGYQAKYDRAKLAYFMGDFKWAQAQLDILKGSTSKLIANDAFYLSELIADNIVEGDSSIPLRLFASAELLEFKNYDSLSLLTLDSIIEFYPTASLSDKILYKKAYISQKHHQYTQAADYLKKIIDNYPESTSADDAAYHLALIYENKLNNPEEAAKYYKKVLIDYKSSIFVNDCRNHYRALVDKVSDTENQEEDFFYDIKPEP